jgi:hypothetical protein
MAAKARKAGDGADHVGLVNNLAALCPTQPHRLVPGRVPSEAVYLTAAAIGLLAAAWMTRHRCIRAFGLLNGLGCWLMALGVWALTAYLVADWDHAAELRLRLGLK